MTTKVLLLAVWLLPTGGPSNNCKLENVGGGVPPLDTAVTVKIMESFVYSTVPLAVIETSLLVIGLMGVILVVATMGLVEQPLLLACTMYPAPPLGRVTLGQLIALPVPAIGVPILLEVVFS